MNSSELSIEPNAQVCEAESKPTVRKDLRWDFHASRSEWIGFDPITSSYFRLNEFEYFATQLMDGTRSVDEIVAGMNRRFALVSIDVEWLSVLLRRLQSSFLMQPSSTSSSWIASQYRPSSKGLLKQLLANPLSIRVPVWLPSSSLSLLKLPARILFHELTVTVVIVVAMFVATLVVRSLMQNLHQIDINPARITADRWLILIVCYLAAKSLHELGHLLACVRYSVRSSEVGVLLLCLMPCFYCDTSDAWKLHSKWQRAMVSAAGMYIEIILAIIAGIIWLTTLPGTLNLVAMNMMVVCSISTVLVNANPLFRFDGYYILSDLWGIPNLHEQSRIAIGQLFSKYVLRSSLETQIIDGNPWMLSAFALLSMIYRTVTLVAILWMCWTVLPPMGLGLVALFVSLSVAVGICSVYMHKIRGALREARRISVAQLFWNVGVYGVLGLICIGVLCLPIQKKIHSRAIADFADKQPIFVSHDARVIHAADRNKLHLSGSELIRMQSVSAQLEITELRGKIKRLESSIAVLQQRQTSDPESSYQITIRREELAKLRAREIVLAQEIEHLVFVAPSDGYLFDENVVDIKELAAVRDDRAIPTVFSKEFEGCWTKRGQLIAWFSPRAKPVVIALVPESEINQVNIGVHAEMRSDCDASKILKGSVIGIAHEPVSRVPKSLLGDESLVSIPGAHGEYETEIPHYEVTIELPTNTKIPYAMPCSVKFPLDSAPIYRHIADFVKRSMKPLWL